MFAGDTPGALAGVRVLDFTMYLPGPYGSMLMADLGADVIHVEPLQGEPGRTATPTVDGDSTLHQWVGRNKRSLALDLKDPNDLERCRSLIRQSDVIIEGFTPGVAERLEIDADSCRRLNPSLIYCSISGLGHGHTFSSSPIHDINLMALSGFMDRTRGSDGAPAIIGPPVADMAAGLHAAVGILAALIHRSVTGEGQFIDVSMLGSAVAMAGPQLVKALAPSPVLPSEDPNLGADPAYRTYATADGSWITLGAVEDKFWRRFCAVVQREDLVGLRDAEPAKAVDALETMFLREPLAHWDDLLRDANVCYAPVLTAESVIDDPVIVIRGDMIDLDGTPQPANPIRMSATPARMRHRGPRLSTADQEWLPRH